MKKPAAASPLTLRAYARHRASLGLSGTTHKAVAKAIAAGRLARAAGRNGRGRPVILDAAQADLEWSGNTDAGRRRGTGRLAEAEGREAAAAAGNPAASASPLASARARREAALASMAEDELRLRRGELTEAAGVRAEWKKIIMLTRSRILGLPSKIKSRLPDLTLDDVAVIDALVRESLEELAAEGKS